MAKISLSFETYVYTGFGTHSYSDLISMGRMHMYYSANSITDNVNFVHQVVYMCEAEVELSRDLNP